MPNFGRIGRGHVTHSEFSIYTTSNSNGRIYPNQSYRNIEISDSLKDFLCNTRRSFGSTACYYFSSFLLRDLEGHSINKIDDEVFSKINSISHSDDGYVIINCNQKIKLGKLVVKVGESVGVRPDDKSEAIGIENFVDEYKSWYKKISNLKFKVLKGEEILSGYDRGCQARNHGMLSNSCMNDKFFLLDLYVKNSDKIELLTLVDDNGRIYGRAFLWKLDNRPFVFMDRVYGVDNYVTKIFNKYAQESKMAYREQQQSFNFQIYLPDGHVTNSEIFPLKTKLNTKNIKYLPYMDSLYIWNKWGNTFSTGKTDRFMNFYVLKSTCGSRGNVGLKILGVKIKNNYE